MDRKYIEDWLDILKRSWLNKDSNKAASLFTNTNFYQETPFIKLYTNIEEINEEWQYVKNENVQKSARNIEGVKTSLTSTINIHDLLNYNKLILTVDSVKKLEEVYA